MALKDRRGCLHDEENGRFIAKTLIRISFNFFKEKGLDKQTAPQIRRGTRKIIRRISEHYKKLESPADYCKLWNELPQIEKDGLIKYWKKELRGKEADVKDRIQYLKDLGENTDEFDN